MYSQLARQLVGNHEGVSAPADFESTDVVSRLLHLTGAEIAREDVRVSDHLQRFPASWADHETAALVLVSPCRGHEHIQKSGKEDLAGRVALGQTQTSHGIGWMGDP